MSALDEIITGYQDAGGLKTELPSAARAELSALRESVATLTARNAEQARRIDEAREIMQHFSGAKVASDRQMALDWLSATAPAPQDVQP